MIMVIGGAHQGKLKQVLKWLAMDMQDARRLYADGRSDGFQDIKHKPVIYGIQAYLARCKAEQVDPEVWIAELINRKPDYVIMDEVGYGVVPASPEQREYREIVGHAGQALAGAAESVYRIVCGIPVKIK